MIGFIVADHEVAFLTEQIDEDEGQARIAVIERSDMPRPDEPFEDRREGMHRHQQRLAPFGRPPVEEGGDRGLVRQENVLDPGPPLRRRNADIGRNWRQLADLGYGARNGWIAIAVDHQARIDLFDERRIEGVRHQARHAGRSYVPGDVPVEFGGRQPHIAKDFRDLPAGVVARQEEGRGAVRTPDNDRIRFVRLKQPAFQRLHDFPSPGAL